MGPLGEGKVEVMHPGSADSAQEKEMTTSHMHSRDSLHCLKVSALLKNLKLKSLPHSN